MGYPSRRSRSDSKKCLSSQRRGINTAVNTEAKLTVSPEISVSLTPVITGCGPDFFNLYHCSPCSPARSALFSSVILRPLAAVQFHSEQQSLAGRNACCGIALHWCRRKVRGFMGNDTLKARAQSKPWNVLAHGLRATSVRPTLALILMFLHFLVGCGGGGSGSSGGGTPPPPPPPSNPAPAIVSLSPNSASVGGNAFTVTITGYNFMSSSAVLWNGSARTTTYTSSTQVQAQITAADIANSGSAQLSVTNPAPGGGNSGAAEFFIKSAR